MKLALIVYAEIEDRTIPAFSAGLVRSLLSASRSISVNASEVSIHLAAIKCRFTESDSHSARTLAT